MIDTTILIDQSYFLQDNENIKTPEEKAKDFIKEFTKATKESELLNSLFIEDQDEVLSEFLFKCLEDYSIDTSNLPSKQKLDNYIFQSRLSHTVEEEKVEEETKEGEVNLESQGLEVGEEDFEELEELEDDENSEDSGNSGEPVNLEESSTGNGGVDRITVENPREIQDGESITIRRDRSNIPNRFF